MGVFNSNKTAVIMIGLQASGKTTYYQRYYADTHDYINLDTLRTRAKEAQLLANCIKDGRSFVADNTNPTTQDRARYILPAKQAGYRVIGLFFRSVATECMSRNSGRSAKVKVPPVAIATTAKRLELPRLSEGFDELYYVSLDANTYSVVDWRELSD